MKMRIFSDRSQLLTWSIYHQDVVACLSVRNLMTQWRMDVKEQRIFSPDKIFTASKASQRTVRTRNGFALTGFFGKSNKVSRSANRPFKCLSNIVMVALNIWVHYLYIYFSNHQLEEFSRYKYLDVFVWIALLHEMTIWSMNRRSIPSFASVGPIVQFVS